MVSGSSTNADGSAAHIIIAEDTLFGYSYGLGPNGAGVIWSMGIEGQNFRVLHAFSAFGDYFTNLDGGYPVGLVYTNQVLYGATERGGPEGVGTLFRMNADGSDFRTFQNQNVEFPKALVMIGDTLYGPAGSGFCWIFAVNKNDMSSRVFTRISEGDPEELDYSFIFSGERFFGNIRRTGIDHLAQIYVVEMDGSQTIVYEDTFSQFDVNLSVAVGKSVYSEMSILRPRGTPPSNSWGFFEPICDHSGELKLMDSVKFYGLSWELGNPTNTLFKVDIDGSNYTDLFTFPSDVRVEFGGWGLVRWKGDFYGGATGKSLALYKISMRPEIALSISSPNLPQASFANLIPDANYQLQVSDEAQGTYHDLGSSFSITNKPSSVPITIDGSSDRRQFFRLQMQE